MHLALHHPPGQCGSQHAASPSISETGCAEQRRMAHTPIGIFACLPPFSSAFRPLIPAATSPRKREASSLLNLSAIPLDKYLFLCYDLHQLNRESHSYPERRRDRPCEASATWYVIKVPIPAEQVFWKMRGQRISNLFFLQKRFFCGISNPLWIASTARGGFMLSIL
jgi:hypothetical protein